MDWQRQVWALHHREWYSGCDLRPMEWTSTQPRSAMAGQWVPGKAMWSRCWQGAVRLCPRFCGWTTPPCLSAWHCQRLFYSGHERVHCLKFRSIMCPNGIMAHMFGPMEGCRYDSAMLEESGLLQQLQDQMMRDTNGVFACMATLPAPLPCQIWPEMNKIATGKRVMLEFWQYFTAMGFPWFPEVIQNSSVPCCQILLSCNTSD